MSTKSLRGSKFAPVPHRKRKGQYLVIEEVLLFSVGIAIFGGLLFLSSDFKEEISTQLSTKQLDEVSQYVVNGAYALQKLDGKSKVFIEIPKEIAGEDYTIIGSENKNEIITYNHLGILVKTPATIRVSGTVHSAQGKILMMLNGPEVSMRGVTDY